VYRVFVLFSLSWVSRDYGASQLRVRDLRKVVWKSGEDMVVIEYGRMSVWVYQNQSLLRVT
jgi:hypothetical protein